MSKGRGLWLVRRFIDAIFGHSLGPGVSALVFIESFDCGWSLVSHGMAKMKRLDLGTLGNQKYRNSKTGSG